MTLRPYQRDAVDSVLGSWRAGRRAPAVVMATGGGKTPTFAHLVTMCANSGRPSLVLAHRTELIEQAAEEIIEAAPHLRVGIMQGRQRQWAAQVIVGSVQTVSRPGALALLRGVPDLGLVVVDECHHAAADSYVRIMRETGAGIYGAGPLVLGVTATLDRADGLALGEIFDDVPFTIGLLELIRTGHLVPPRGVRVRVDMNLDAVKRTGGDFQSGDLSRAMHDALAPAAIVRAYLEHAAGRPAIAFLPTVELSIEQASVFVEHGIRAVHLDGATPREERRLALKAYRAGEIDVLCNVGLFTEGTNLPMTSCVILGRPTSSSVLYQQMVGRGLRLFEGKRDCVVLDVVGVTGRHRLATLASLDGAARPEDVPDELLMYEDDRELEIEVAVEPEPVPPADPGPPDPYGVDGPLAAEMVDLFGSASAAWLRTERGRWFIALPNLDGFVYLDPAGEGRVDLRYVWRGSEAGLVHEDPLTIEHAMQVGEAFIEARPMWQLGRDAKWRAGRPTATLIRHAGDLGIGRDPGMTRGELFDVVAVRMASRVLDPADT